MLVEHAWVHIPTELMDCVCSSVKFQEQFSLDWDVLTVDRRNNGYTEELVTEQTTAQWRSSSVTCWMCCTGLE